MSWFICFFVVLCDMCEPRFLLLFCIFRKEGQDTKDELQKRNLRHELEERERRHFSSKDKSYNGKTMLPMSIILPISFSVIGFPTFSSKKRRILILINISLLQMTEIVGRVAIFCWKVNIPACLTLYQINDAFSVLLTV